jgi:hypothetical protein
MRWLRKIELLLLIFVMLMSAHRVAGRTHGIWV